MKAIEFYSGIGAFAEAVRGNDLEVVAAFDQNPAANSVYEANFGLKPSNKNLDSIKIEMIPDAQVWWMSPPCTPFSVRGKMRDMRDSRAKSLLRLIDFAAIKLPNLIMIENVLGFVMSEARQYIKDSLQPHGYSFREYDMCSTDFGIPMRRPRYFMIACRTAASSTPGAVARAEPRKLTEFLFDDDETLVLTPETMNRYGQGFDLVDPDDEAARLICFTKNYARCMLASGSLLKNSSGVIRRVSPEEILRLLDFSEHFQFPPEIDRETRWRLVGNSVDVRAIRFLLQEALTA